MNKGFTLIELLVVVLIIGILAAVALPNYQTAILKSRIGSAIQIADAIKLGAEMDYIENRSLTDDTSDLAIELPPACGKDSAGQVVCPNLYVDLLSNGTGGSPDVVVLSPNKEKAEVGYRVYLNIPLSGANAGRRECLAVAGNKRAEAACRSLTGKSNPTGTFSYVKSWNAYSM